MTLHLTIKVSTGSKFTIDADEELTVAQFKELLEPESKIPPAQQRLIYAGHVLKDGNTLAACLIKDGHTVHLVRGAAPPGTARPGAQTAAATPSPAAAPTQPAVATPNPLLGEFGGMGGLGAAPSMDQARQMMQQNPEMMRQMMQQPWVQEMMSDPSILQNFMENNPEMRSMMASNPEIAQAMRDPELLRQTTEMMANPEMMQEFQRNMDRTMGHIETMPGGFNQLASMFQGIQEPMEQAARDATQTRVGHEGAAVPEPTEHRPTTQTTTAMPNPWAPSTGETATQNTAPPAAGQPGAGMSGMPGMGGMGMPSADDIAGMLQNPAAQQMMQSMMSNPEVMNSMIQTNPMLQQAVNANPALRDQLSDPETLRQMSEMMSNPEAMRNIIQMQNAMQGLSGMGLGGMFGAGGAPGTGAGQQNMMQQMMGLGGTPPSTQQPAADPRIVYRDQLSQLNDMGFTDESANTRALIATGGNIQAAIERLLSGM